MESSDDNQVSILYRNGLLLVAQTDLRVSCSQINNRTTLPDPLEHSIETEWTSRCAANPTLWNGSKFRLASICVDNNNSIAWNLGLTCYKDFIGTNLSANAKELQKLGKENHSNAQAYMSDPLGVGALLLTSDNHVVLLKRSDTCAEAPGWYDIPGGHAEPEEITGKVDISAVDYSVFSTENLQKEIYLSVLREIRDEVNLPMERLEQPLLLGIALSHVSNGRPSSNFIVRTSLSSEQVVKLYNDGTQAEADESTNIKLLTHEQVLAIRHSPTWDTLAASAKGCFLLYIYYVEQCGS